MSSKKVSFSFVHPDTLTRPQSICELANHLGITGIFIENEVIFILIQMWINNTNLSQIIDKKFIPELLYDLTQLFTIEEFHSEYLDRGELDFFDDFNIDITQKFTLLKTTKLTKKCYTCSATINTSFIYYDALIEFKCTNNTTSIIKTYIYIIDGCILFDAHLY